MILITFGLLAACSSVSGIEATVVRDCTGTYVRVDGKDHLVCNKDKLSTFKEGDSVRVRFKQTSFCNENKDEMVCMMYHEHEGLVKVVNVIPK
jgi:hypothetical protein